MATPTIHFVIALPAEARPLLDHFRLKQVASHPFPIYHRDDYWLVVSGIGKTLAAAATAYLAAQSGAGTASIWLNIGVAGHDAFSLGTACIALEVEEASTASKWYPQIVPHHPWEGQSLRTQDQPETQYPQSRLYDMEAAGFFRIATRFSTLEFIQSIKIVSDNQQQGLALVTPKRAQDWIERQVTAIDSFAQALANLSPTKDKELPLQILLGELTQQFRLSVTEQHKARWLLQKMQALQLEPLDFPWQGLADKQALQKKFAQVEQY